jgi:hypothetical protein
MLVQVKPVITTVSQCQWFTICDWWQIESWENKVFEDKLLYLQISIFMMQGLNCRLNGHVCELQGYAGNGCCVHNKYEKFLP